MRLPDLPDVERAERTIRRFLLPTPAYEWPGLSEELGCSLVVKHENHLPVGAFKVRGGVNLIANLPDEERRRGVIAATRGNHGLSIAWAARRFSVYAEIVVPEGNNPEKNAAMRALGANVVERGADYDEAREHVEETVRSKGYRYVHSANEPELIAGVGTWALELFRDVEEIDALFVPVGLGSGICGACVVRDALSPGTRVIGVQSELAPAVARSWREGRAVTTESARTFADGLATRVPAELTLGGMRRGVQDFALVGEDAIAGAIRDLLRHTHNLAEGAGAAPLAAIRARREELRGRRVAMVLSGGNLSSEALRCVLEGGTPPA